MGCLGQKKSFDINNHNTKSDENTVQSKEPKTPCFAWRYYIATLICTSSCMINIQRAALAIVMVNMTNFTSMEQQQNTNSTSCPRIINSQPGASQLEVGGDFNWDSKLQGFILGAGFMGSAVMPMLAGPLADVTGAKQILLWGNVVSSVAMLISPMVSWWHVYVLIFVHLVRGIAQGFIIPSNFLVIAKWTPRSERGFISCIMIGGYHAGSVLGGLIAGYLCGNPSLGWPAVFYFFGVVGIFFSILFALTFYEAPKDHPRISEEELKYITEDQVGNKNEKKLMIPWRKMFTSIRTFALIYALFGHYWGSIYFISTHQLYLSSILHYPIKKNGLVSSLTFIPKILAALLASSLSDWLYRKKYLGVDKLRKGCTLIASLGYSLSFLGIFFSGCNNLANIVFLATCLFFNGVATPGSMIAAVDMTPNFSGTLMGIAGPFCYSTGFIVPIMVGFLTKDASASSLFFK